MKTIKVSDSLHSRLIELSKRHEIPVNQLITELLDDEEGNLLEQMHMRFDGLEEMIKSDGHGPVKLSAAQEEITETKQQKFLRIKKEAEAQEKARRYAIEHPEECDQTREYIMLIIPTIPLIYRSSGKTRRLYSPSRHLNHHPLVLLWHKKQVCCGRS